MSFTRFHDDPARIRKQVEESSFAGKYALNVPGPGDSMPFQEDPQLRMQKWGANVQTNIVHLESDLWGLSRKLNRDIVEKNQYQEYAAPSHKIDYPVARPFVDESRASCPAWMFRDVEQTRWEEPIINPQYNVEKGFHENIQTRILEKDHFVPRIPVVQGNPIGNTTATTKSFRLS